MFKPEIVQTSIVKEVNVTVPVDVDVALDATVSGFGFKTFVPGSATGTDAMYLFVRCDEKINYFRSTTRESRG